MNLPLLVDSACSILSYSPISDEKYIELNSIHCWVRTHTNLSQKQHNARGLAGNG